MHPMKHSDTGFLTSGVMVPKKRNWCPQCIRTLLKQQFLTALNIISINVKACGGRYSFKLKKNYFFPHVILFDDIMLYPAVWRETSTLIQDGHNNYIARNRHGGMVDEFIKIPAECRTVTLIKKMSISNHFVLSFIW